MVSTLGVKYDLIVYRLLIIIINNDDNSHAAGRPGGLLVVRGNHPRMLPVVFVSANPAVVRF